MIVIQQEMGNNYVSFIHALHVNFLGYPFYSPLKMQLGWKSGSELVGWRLLLSETQEVNHIQQLLSL